MKLYYIFFESEKNIINFHIYKDWLIRDDGHFQPLNSIPYWVSDEYGFTPNISPLNQIPPIAPLSRLHYLPTNP